MSNSYAEAWRESLLKAFKRISGHSVNRALNILFIPIVAFIITLKLQEFFNINLVLIAAALIYTLKNIFLDESRFKRARFNSMDLSVCLIALVELICYFASTYRANSFYYLTESFFLLLFYCLVRYNLQYEWQRLTLFFFFCLWAIFLPIVGFVSHYRLMARLRVGGFEDITNFRNHIYVLNPIGLSIGEWVTVLFLILPFPVILFIRFKDLRIARWGFFVISTAMLATMLMTFIRGVYIAVAAFFLIATVLFHKYRIFQLKHILRFNALMALLTLIALLPAINAALTTVSMFKTTSQARSFEGRKSIWKNSLEMIKDHPLLGVGANNFTMQYEIYKDEEGSFALRSFNYFLQILTERGVLGFIAYLILIITFLRISHRKIKLLGDDTYGKSVIALFMIAYLAILIRDLSESSILINKGVQITLWFMFAHNARVEDLEDSVDPKLSVSA